jgi:hypothetical protein
MIGRTGQEFRKKFHGSKFVVGAAGKAPFLRASSGGADQG